MSQNAPVTIKLEIDGKQIIEEALTLKLASVIENRIKRKIVDTLGRVSTRVTGKRLAAIASVFSALTETSFEKNAIADLNDRVFKAYQEKFETKGFGTWRQIKLRTIRRRQWLVTQGAKREYGPTHGITDPLWFSGTLRDVVLDHTRFTRFKFLKFGEAHKGSIELKDIDIGYHFTSPKNTIAPKWYFKTRKQKRPSFTTFDQILKHQTKKGWPIWLTQPEFLEHVWLPFLDNDFAKLFRRGSRTQQTKDKVVGVFKPVMKEMIDEIKISDAQLQAGALRFQDNLLKEIKSMVVQGEDEAYYISLLKEKLKEYDLTFIKKGN